MTKNILCVALATLFASTTLSAHHGNGAEHQESARKTNFAKDGVGSHWFVELGNSASFNFSGTNYKIGARKAGINYLNPSLSVGRWHNPYFATSAKLSLNNIIDRFRLDNQFVEGEHTFLSAKANFMFDVVNFFSPYKENRFFHVIPFLSVGATRHLDSDYTPNVNAPRVGHWSALAGGGLQLKFRVSERFDLNIEGEILGKDTRLNSEQTTKTNYKGLSFTQSFLGTLGASVTYHIGKKEFTPIVKQDDALLANLNTQINQLREENIILSQRPVDCPEIEAPAVQGGIAVGNVVYFRLNSAVVDANQLINIRNIAEYAKNNTETITLVGYADRQTGTPEYNYKLSERRAEAVKKILVEKYGISADRIKASWEGDRKQPYAENVWNRIVIMNAE